MVKPNAPIFEVLKANKYQLDRLRYGYDFGGFDYPFAKGMEVIDIELGHNLDKPLVFDTQHRFINCAMVLRCCKDLGTVADNIDKALAVGGYIRIFDYDIIVLDIVRILLKKGHYEIHNIFMENRYLEEEGPNNSCPCWDIDVNLIKHDVKGTHNVID